MTNGNLPANPITNPGDFWEFGLTKREAFAMSALNGSATDWCGCNDRDIQKVADTAVRLADALVAALNRSAAVDHLGSQDAVHDGKEGF